MLSHEVVNFHEWTPQQARAYPTNHSFQPTVMYKFSNEVRKSVDKPVSGAEQLDPVRQSWIGKYFIPSGYQPANPGKNNYVYESEIAKHCNPWAFQILWIGHPDTPKFVALGTGINTVSKPDINYNPGRTTIFIDHNDVIRKIEFL
jgi:hypothetical protein